MFHFVIRNAAEDGVFHLLLLLIGAAWGRSGEGGGGGGGGVYCYSGWAVFIAVPFRGLRAGGFAWLGFVMPVFFVCAFLLWGAWCGWWCLGGLAPSGSLACWAR